jgi:N-acetylglucosamine-6-phosphate deacetylase
MVKDAVKNMVCAAHIDLKSVLKMAAVNPAKVIGVDGFKGRIKKGYDADINILNEDLDVVMTMVMGKVIKNSLH